MSEIKVGEYVRTNKGNMGKVLSISNVIGQKRNKYLVQWNISKAYYITDIRIVKHSPNIIDLIEEGDYINGERVEKIAEPSLANCQKKLIYCNECEGLYKLILDNEDIKSIVTHEQFAQMEYKVEEEK